MIKRVLLIVLALSAACGRPDHWHVRQSDVPEPLLRLPPADERAAEDEEPGPVAMLEQDAEGRYRLSVEEAVFTAIRYNKDLLMQQLDYDISQTFEDIERGVFDPRAFARIEAGEARSSETDRGTGNQFEVDSEFTGAVIGLRQELPAGTDIELDVSIEQDKSDRTPDQSEARVGLSVTQALLRGLGGPVNTARISQAAIDARISRFELRGFAEMLVYETESSYWRLVAANERIAAVESALQLARQQRMEIKERIAVGVAAQNQLPAAESELALNQQAAIDARSQRNELRLQLLALMQLPDENLFSRDLQCSSDADIERLDYASEVDEHVRLAMIKRADLGEARLLLEQQRLETVVTKNGLMPRLDFFVELGKTGFGPGTGDAFNHMDDDTYDVSVGLDFSYRLGDRSAAARNRAAFAGEKRAAAAVRNLQQQIELDVRLAWNECQRAKQQITASRTSVVLQEETLRSERERLQAGVGTSLLVAQAQRDLLQARFALIRAISAYRIALINLYRADGSLLERRGLVLSF